MRSPIKKQKRKRIQTLDSDEEEEDNLSYQQNRAKRHSQDDDEDDFEQNANQNEGAGDINLEDWNLEPGVIEYVKMKNFMCHEVFDYFPTRKVNFLTGVNGSGKSAVMSALIFGLGGGSKITNRGSANKNLIRTGQGQASVEISLYNRGETAYRSDVYGDRIKIFRSVSEKGGGVYKLKNEHGKVVREKRVKEELSRILGCYNIQLDNPIAILPQDTAKTMLFSLKAEKLYEFFMKATQLEEVLAWYHEASDDLEIAKVTLDRKSAQATQHAKDLRKCEKKHKLYLQIDEQKHDIDRIKKELVYAQFNESKYRYEFHVDEFEKVKAKIAELESRYESSEDKKNSLIHERETLENDREKVKDGFQNIQKEVSEMRAQLRTAKTESKKVQSSKDVQERSKREKQKLLESVQKVLADTKSRSNADEEKEREERRDHINSLEAAKQELEARLQSTRNHADNLQHNSDVAKHESNAIQMNIREANGRIRENEREMRNAQSQGNSKLAFYGEKIPKLVEEIKKHKNKFQKPPIGPIGIEVEIRENVSKKHVEVIETELGKLLSSFLVDNFQDKRVLDKMAKSVGINITIITSKYLERAHDVSQGCCRSKFPTILSLLQVENVNVVNCLIDQKKVEKVIIMDNEEDARHLLKSAQTAPRNLLYSLALNKHNGNLSQYYPDPNYRTYAVNQNRRDLGKLQTSAAEHLERLNTELEACRAEVEKLNTDLHEHHANCKSNDSELKKAKNTCSEINREIGAISNNLNDLKQEDQNDTPADIGALEDDEERYQEQIAKIEQEIQNNESEIKAAKLRSDEVEKNLHKKEEEADEYDENKFDDKLAEIDRKIEKQVNTRQIIGEKLKKFESDKEIENGKVTEARNHFVQQKEAVKILAGDTIETKRKPKDIKQQIYALAEGIKKSEQMQEPREVFEKRLETMREEYETLYEGIEYCKIIVGRALEMVKDRSVGFFEIRGYMCRRVKIAFSNHLEARNFNGLLNFDHKPEPVRDKNGMLKEPLPTLTLMVNPEGGQTLKRRDMKTLSGGEKSFSTVSLILALWEEIQPPFRMLDEFDVFMDMMNRNKSVEMILDFARENRDFQYFFLTPLDTNMLDKPEYKKDVSVQTVIKNDD